MGPTARSDRTFNWGESAIAPDAVGKMITGGLQIPFYLEYELRARHPRGVLARLRPYTSYYWSTEPGADQPAPISLHAVRRGRRGGRSHLREHSGPDEPDDAADSRVVFLGAVTHRDTWTVRATPLGT